MVTTLVIVSCRALLTHEYIDLSDVKCQVHVNDLTSDSNIFYTTKPQFNGWTSPVEECFDLIFSYYKLKKFHDKICVEEILKPQFKGWTSPMDECFTS